MTSYLGNGDSSLHSQPVFSTRLGLLKKKILLLDPVIISYSPDVHNFYVLLYMCKLSSISWVIIESFFCKRFKGMQHPSQKKLILEYFKNFFSFFILHFIPTTTKKIHVTSGIGKEKLMAWIIWRECRPLAPLFTIHFKKLNIGFENINDFNHNLIWCMYGINIHFLRNWNK